MDKQEATQTSGVVLILEALRCDRLQQVYEGGSKHCIDNLLVSVHCTRGWLPEKFQSLCFHGKWQAFAHNCFLEPDLCCSSEEWKHSKDTASKMHHDCSGVQIGTFEIAGLKPHKTGEIVIRVEMTKDINGLLSVHATNASSGAISMNHPSH